MAEWRWPKAPFYSTSRAAAAAAAATAAAVAERARELPTRTVSRPTPPGPATDAAAVAAVARADAPMAVAAAAAAVAPVSAAATATAAEAPPTQVRRWRGVDHPARLLSLSLSVLLSLSLASAAAVNGSAVPSASLPQSTRGRPTDHGRSDIIFPDSQVSQFKPRLLGSQPSCIQEGSTYCENGVEDYPKAHLNQILDNIIGYREYFGNDTIEEQKIGDRFGALGETTMCASKEQIIFPKMGQNANGEWRFIVNQDDENFKQGIRVELCEKEDQPCKYANTLPAGTNAVCRQKYIYRKMISLSEGGDTLPDSFRMPSCCACFINSDLLTRTLPVSRSSSRRKR